MCHYLELYKVWMNKLNKRAGDRYSEEERLLCKIVFRGNPSSNPASSKKRCHEFFACKFLHYKRNPDSLKCVTGIWNWTKRHLFRTNCSCLLLSEKTKNKHWCHAALVPTARLTQLWQSKPNNMVKEEMKGGNREHGRIKNNKSRFKSLFKESWHK